MLALDSPEWATLDHAYGSAIDVPAVLRRVEAGDRPALSDLYGRIFHQTSIYSASVAALPHLVRIAGACTDDVVRVELVALIGGIHNGVAQQPVAVRDGLQRAHAAAIPDARKLAATALKTTDDADLALHLLQALAAFDGHLTLGSRLQDLIGGELFTQCPSCECEICLVTVDEGLCVALDHRSDDWVRVESTSELAAKQLAQRTWLAQHASAPVLERYRGQADDLFGRAKCPGCGQDFIVIDALEAG